jgi:hypothetical protein
MGIGGSSTALSITAIGKCDVCGDFHIWCWDCGGQFCLGDNSELKCNCNHPWFWLTSIEDDEISDGDNQVFKSVYLFLVTLTDTLIADRKPLN